MRPRYKTALYGDSGGGKTTMIGTAPKPIVAATDENKLRLQVMKVPYREILQWTDLLQLREELSQQLFEGTCPYETACIDTLTATEQLITKNFGVSYLTLEQWGKQVIPQWRDEMLAWCNLSNPKKFPKQQLDVIFTARVEYMVAQDGSRYGTIECPGKALSKEVYGWMDEVFYIRAESGINASNETFERHILHTRRYENYLAKDGSGCLSAVEIPDFGVINDKITAALGSLDVPNQ